MKISIDIPSVEPKLNSIISLLGGIKQTLQAILAKETEMAGTIDDILTGVNEETTLEDSIIQLLTNALANAGVPQAKIDAVLAVVTSNKQKLNDAITAATPVPPQPVA